MAEVWKAFYPILHNGFHALSRSQFLDLQTLVVSKVFERRFHAPALALALALAPALPRVLCDLARFYQTKKKKKKKCGRWGGVLVVTGT